MENTVYTYSGLNIMIITKLWFDFSELLPKEFRLASVPIPLITYCQVST